jgi:hypothetical protein
MTKMLARLVISIGLLGPCALPEIQDPKRARCRASCSPRTPMEAAPCCRARRFL